MKNILVHCRGITPLLMNKMEDKTLHTLLGTIPKEPKTKKLGSTVTPFEIAEKKVYRRGALPVLPALNIMSCLIAAGVFVRLDAKRQVSTGKSTMLPGFLSIGESFIPLTDAKGGVAQWEADIMQGKNPNGNEAVAICRPRFDEWRFAVPIQIDTEEIGENLIRDLWDKAGRRIGLGDFRPFRKGIFGQFVVQNWEERESLPAAAE